jgi:hypothetical protein
MEFIHLTFYAEDKKGRKKIEVQSFILRKKAEWRPQHSSGSESPTFHTGGLVSIPSQFMWHLWQTQVAIGFLKQIFIQSTDPHQFSFYYRLFIISSLVQSSLVQ